MVRAARWVGGMPVQAHLLLVGSTAPTIYLPALAETDARFGTEAALSAFDAQFTSSMLWEKNSTPQNSSALESAIQPQDFRQDLATFQAQIAQTNATGGQWAISNTVNYELNNIALADKEFNSVYDTNVTLQVKQPILRGAGVAFDRIAGPGAVPGLNQGILIARLRTDVSLAQFESNVRNTVNDVEKAYWNLYYAYRQLDTAISGRDAGLESWRKVHARMVAGAADGSARRGPSPATVLCLSRRGRAIAQRSVYDGGRVALHARPFGDGWTADPHIG